MSNGGRRTNHSSATWSSGQAYALGIFCLAFGLVLGYLFRGSAPQAPSAPAESTATAPSSPAPGGMLGSSSLSPAQKAEMTQQAAAPLLQALKANPNDFGTLAKAGNLYYDSQQYAQAIEYYQRAIKLRPENSDVRTDLGTAYWYTGDADKAIAEFNRALKYQPTHPGTLFNMGVVKWQGKLDPAGAVEAWERLLKTNPNYPQKQQVLDLIDRAKQHAKS